MRATGVILFGLAGMAVNGAAVVAMLRAGSSRDDLNLRGALLHTIADVAGSAGVVLAGVLVAAFGWNAADPVIALLVAALCIVSARRLIAEPVRILLERAPASLDPEAIGRALCAVEGVREVHDVHAWTITSGFDAVSVHVIAAPGTDQHALLHRLEEVLRTEFDVHHTTIQVDRDHPARSASTARDARKHRSHGPRRLGSTSTTTELNRRPLSMPSVEELSITTIRTLAMDAVQKANSGHPGTAMALAPVAYLLYEEEMRHDPGDPHWPNRDRFVLSAGHACILQYAALHLAGYDLSIDDLKAFRQWESKTPGHPEMHHTPGIETTTGPLGQGVGNSVGMALAERMLAARYNRPGHEIVDHHTYCICSRRRPAGGRLGRGVVDRRAPRPRPADVLLRRQPHLDRGRHRPVVHRGRGRALPRLRLARAAVDDTWTLDTLRAAVAEAHADPRPSMIILRTHIAPGAPNKQDTASAHGEPLGVDEIRLTKRAYGWPEDAEFFVPDEVRRALRPARAGQGAARPRGQDAFDAYRAAHPDLAAEFERTQAGTLPDDWADAVPAFTPDDGAMATRAAGGKVLQALAEARARAGRRLGRPGPVHQHPDEGRTAASRAGDYSGRNFHWGIREHGMGSVLNGLSPTAACAGSARRSSSSPTTCARRCDSQRSWACPSSTSGRTTRCGWARTARPTSRSST